ncbi:putative UmuC-like protein [Tetragenococcus halophilus subsp. halophilus]|uniref:UmuC-like protein n=2 Tax=Tetragenococcus halophilus TaxID=51669 RepID=A0AAN1SH41_TETHN|nr:excinuclease ABC subunit A [Tetragenococcus halophilus]BAK94974.1 putative UmuC-like protein [Tetragenococcus halophilus NBRC 12172]GBD61838.1 putative UmuC-like protein [Tetragenococcus halophilus subsp. halophilus]NWO00106.1 Y-family DNA polymerase [Tetragenococcus halophilus]GBD67568.1 putative UmuC-like protein [Tetragenococcus halophilus subsp. halophilus]
MDLVSFNYKKEPLRDILFIDVKSFYATVECIYHGWDPLETLLVVASHADNTGNGLILAASPKAKEILGISNVSRIDNLPDHPLLKQVPPRMRLYIKENVLLNNLFKTYVAPKDLLIYSIDESILDITYSLNLFFPDLNLSRQEKRWLMARKIQTEVYEKTGLILSVGIGDNPLLAKLALDTEAKYRKENSYMAEWTYQDVKNKVWQIDPMTEFWGIGSRTKKQLAKIGINTIEQLANSNIDLLYYRFGVIGEQLYHHANGIDRTILAETPPTVKEKSYGNSQVLPKNYTKQREIEIVISELAEQVAARIRRHGYFTSCVHLYIGAAYGETDGDFSHQMKIPATNTNKELKAHCLRLFRQYYQGQAIRHIGISYSKLTYIKAREMDLFEDVDNYINEERLDKIIDKIRAKYGFHSIFYATSKLEGARSLARSHLVGGHNGGAGGMDGLS